MQIAHSERDVITALAVGKGIERPRAASGPVLATLAQELKEFHPLA